MEFSINREVFTTLLSRAAMGAVKRATRATLTGVNVVASTDKSLSLIGTDLDTWVIAEGRCIGADGYMSIVIEPKAALAALKNMREDLLTVSAKVDSLEIELICGKTSLKLQALGFGADYPTPPTVSANSGAFTLAAHEAHSIIDKVSYCASQVDKHSILGGVLFSRQAMVLATCATDSSRLAALNVDIETCAKEAEFDAIVPVQALDTLDRLMSKSKRFVRVTAADFRSNHGDKPQSARLVTFDTEHGKLTVRCIDGEYPRYTELFPSEPTGYREFNREELASACKQVIAQAGRNQLAAMVLAGNEAGTVDGAVRMALQSSCSDSVPVSLDARFVASFLNSTKAKTVRFEMHGGDKCFLKPVMLKDNESRTQHLLMPCAGVVYEHNKKTNKRELKAGWWSGVALSNSEMPKENKPAAKPAAKPVKAKKTAVVSEPGPQVFRDEDGDLVRKEGNEWLMQTASGKWIACHEPSGLVPA